MAGRRPIPPQPGLTRVEDSNVQRALDQAHARLKELEARNNDPALSGSVASSILSLSGTFNSAISTNVVALSATLDAQRVWDGLDPLRGTRVFDDHISTTGPSTSDPASGGTVTRASWASGHPGIARLTVTASGTDVAAIEITDTASGLPLFGGGPIEYEACVRIPTADNGINDASRRVGFAPYVNVPVNAVMLEVNRSRYGDNEFRFVTAATGSRVQQKTGVTVGAGQWYRLRINVSPDADAVTGSIFCSGSLISTIATRTYIPGPDTTRATVQAFKFLGGGAVTFDCDYQYYQQTFTGSRI